MSQWSFDFSITSFPVGWQGNYNQFAQKMVSLMSAILVGNIMPGIYSQSTITLPTSDQGPIVMNQQIWIWNPATSSYVEYASTGVPYLRSDNVLDNGDFQIWQRTGGNYSSAVNIAALTTTTTVPSTAANFQADRWYVVQDGTLGQTPTQQQEAAGPIIGASDHPNTLNCLRISANATGTTITANQFCYAAQRIELQRARVLFDIIPSLSLWLRSSVIGTFCVFIQNAAATNSIIFPCGITTANQWQKFTFPAIPTVPYANGGYGSNPSDWSLTAGIVAACGSTYQQSPALDNVWQSALRYSDSSQTQLLATGGATLDMTLIQLENAPTVSAFQFKTFRDSLFDCQRYYSNSYDYGTAPGTGLGGGTYTGAAVLNFVTINVISGYAPFSRQMRAIPTYLTTGGTPVITPGVKLYGPITGTANKAYNINAGGEITLLPASTVVSTKAINTLGSSGAFISDDMYATEYEANAEL